MMQVEKPKDLWGTLKRLFYYIGKNRRAFNLLMVMTLLITATGLIAPVLQQKAIDALEGNLPAQLTLMLLLMILTYFLNAGITYLQARSSALLSQGTVRSLRTDLFEK